MSRARPFRVVYLTVAAPIKAEEMDVAPVGQGNEKRTRFENELSQVLTCTTQWLMMTQGSNEE